MKGIKTNITSKSTFSAKGLSINGNDCDILISIFHDILSSSASKELVAGDPEIGSASLDIEILIEDFTDGGKKVSIKCVLVETTIVNVRDDSFMITFMYLILKH